MRIRPAQSEDAEAIARVHVDAWRTTYTGIIPEDYLERLSYERSAQMWREFLCKGRGKGFLLVAEDKDARVIGFVSGGPLREEIPGCSGYEGEIYAIYVLAGYQRRGVGSRLMGWAFRWLVGWGMETVVVWVLEENPSCRFYEALGGVRIAERTITIAEVDLPEVAYGWSDVAEVVSALTGLSDGASAA